MASAIRLSFHRRLFVMLIAFSWSIIVCFIGFQYMREKQYKQDYLSLQLQLYNRHLLEAVEDKTAPLWNLLRGETHLNRGQFTKAAVCFLRAEDAYPRQCWPKLEQCYRELSNYEKAYEYACKQK